MSRVPGRSGGRRTIAVRDAFARARARFSEATGLGPAAPVFDLDAHEIGWSDRDRLLDDGACDLARMIHEHDGRLLHKWTHYPRIYERHLGHRRGSSFALLEIGVFKGGSLELWRTYFGPRATIYGIDIDPACAAYVDAPNQVRIGAQNDRDFLARTVREMGGLDVVIDDGSHVASHQRATFEALFPRLNTGGVYIIEDLHTSYWPGEYEGGYRRPRTGIETIKDLVDDLHGRYHGRAPVLPAGAAVGAIHVYDSIAVIEAADRAAPAHIKIGRLPP